MRAFAVAVVLVVACGARTGLRTGTTQSSEGGTDSSTDAPVSVCPFVQQIAQTSAKPDAIAISAGFVYWHDAQGVSRVSESGGAVQNVAPEQATIWPDLAPFAVFDGEVFYDQATDGVLRVPITGGTPVALQWSCPGCGFATSASHVYFWPRVVGATFVTRLDANGPPLTVSSYADVPAPPNKIVFETETQAIAATNSGVLDLPSSQVLSGLNATDVVFDSKSIWFTSDDATNGARVIVLELQSQKTTPVPDTFGSFAIAIDATDLYVTDRNAMRIRRIEGKTGPLKDITVEPATFEPVDLALDGACIFWTRSPQFSDTDPGAIMVAPKR